MLSETVTEVCLTQGARAQEWPPALRLLAPPSLTPAWAPGRAWTPVFAANGVWAATPSTGWIWGKETRERRTPQLQIEPSVLASVSRVIHLWSTQKYMACNIISTSRWDYWLKNFNITWHTTRLSGFLAIMYYWPILWWWFFRSPANINAK